MVGGNDFVFAAMLEEGLIDGAGAERAKRLGAERGIAPSEAAASLGLIDQRSLALVRAQTCECPFVDPANYEICYANSRLIPRGTAESLRAFPLFVCRDIVTMGMADPMDLKAVDQLHAILKQDIEPVLCEPKALSDLIERAYALAGGTPVKPVAIEAGADLTTGKEPIVAAVNQIIAQGLDLNSSDIHIGPDDQELHLRYRVDGTLRAVRGPSIQAHPGIIQRLKVMADLDLTQSRRPQDGKFRFTHHGREVDVRVSIIPTVCGENAVLRLLSSAASIRGFTDLGFPVESVEAMETMIQQPYGMILVTGPTGSGKTTTLYTALKRLNTPDVNIMTIEDPVEIRMPMIRQVQVNPQVGMTFAGALRSVLRQDPDVVFVGEIRDEETARISVQAALTGHLVLSSLHTNDAAGAVPRLRDLGCPSFAINAALLTVIAQRLVRRVCPDCARPDSVPASLLARFGLRPGEGTFVRGTGCTRCGSQGLCGRVGIYEMLTIDQTLRAAIDRAAPVTELREVAARSGMRPMAVDGLAKARLGLTTLEEVARVVTVLGEDEPDAPPVHGVEPGDERAAA